MCSRHSEPGAENPDYVLHHYRVRVVEEEGPSWVIDIPAALGRNDARRQAREKAIDSGAIDPAVIEIEQVAA